MTELSRRSFLTGTAALTALAALGEGAPAHAAATGARVTLAEPGPMVPPVPAVLLTVNGMPGDPDEISVVWTFVVNGKPPQIGVSIGHEHVAQRLVARHREFVINVPVVDIVEPFDRVDMNSRRVADKFAFAGLTRGRAVAVDAPTVAECPIQVECRVFVDLELPPARHVFFAEVVAVTALAGAVDADGRLNVPAVPFFGMTAGSGEFYTMGRPVGHIGKSVDRDDIRY